MVLRLGRNPPKDRKIQLKMICYGANKITSKQNVSKSNVCVSEFGSIFDIDVVFSGFRAGIFLSFGNYLPLGLGRKLV